MSATTPSAFGTALSLPEPVQQALYDLLYQQDITPASLPDQVPHLAARLTPLFEDSYGIALTDPRELEALVLSDAQHYLQARK